MWPYTEWKRVSFGCANVEVSLFLLNIMCTLAASVSIVILRMIQMAAALDCIALYERNFFMTTYQMKIALILIDIKLK